MVECGGVVRSRLRVVAAVTAISLAWPAAASASSGVAPPTTGPSTTAPESDTRFSWTRLADPALASTVRGGEFGALVATPGGFVVGGFQLDEAGVPPPQLWRSADGATWSAAALPSPPSGGFVVDGVAVGDTVMLVGSVGGTLDGPLVYRIEAAGTAEMVETSGFPENVNLTEIATTAEGGYLVYGWSGSSLLAFGSADGVAWQPDDETQAVIGGLADPGGPWLAGGPNGMLTVLEDTVGGKVVGRALVHSAGGVVPTELPATGEVDVADALVTDAGFFVFGAERIDTAFTPTLWFSADGAAWEQRTPTVSLSGNQDLSSSYGDTFEEVIWVGDRFVASYYGAGISRMLTSTDATSWSEIPTDTAADAPDVPGVFSLASGGAGVVGISHYPPVVWAVDSAVRQVVDPALPTASDEREPIAVVGVGDYVMIAAQGALWPQQVGADPFLRSDVLTVDAASTITAAAPIEDQAVSDMIALADGSVRAVGSDLLVTATLGRDDPVSPRAWTTWPTGPMNPADVGSVAASDRMHVVVALPSGVLAAAGTRFTAEGPLATAFWRSEDSGLTWSGPSDSFDDGGGDFSGADACALPSGRGLAIGSVDADGISVPQVYATDDGLAWWTSAAGAAPFGADQAVISACVTTPNGVVVVGSTGAPRRAAAWTTTDGETFTALAVPDLGDDSALWGITTTADGRLWMLGWGRPDGADAAGKAMLVEVGTDGSMEPAVALAGEAFDGPLDDPVLWYVVAAGDRLVLVGRFGYDIGVWTSPLPPAT